MSKDKKKKKSVIASLDLKNYKPKYSDPYGDGTARPIYGEEFSREEEAPPTPPAPTPPVEEKIIPPAPPTPTPPVEEKIIPSTNPQPSAPIEPIEPPKEKPKEKFEDIVRRIERNKRKARAVLDAKNTADAPAEPEVDQPNPQHRRVESYGIVISAISLVYSFFVADKAFFFLSMSLLSFLIRPIVGPLFGKHNYAVQNILKGFGIAVFVGAILFIFY